MDPKVEQELRELTEIAARVMEEGRPPTEEERERFLRLKKHLDESPTDWRARLTDEIDRFAAALEGMGI
ncbi:MAG: hypothetical protein ACYTG6_14385 [Planctomycetota bacterium]|jgi:hypothetical protein